MMQVGSIVQLRDNPEAGQAEILHSFGDELRNFYLDRRLGNKVVVPASHLVEVEKQEIITLTGDGREWHLMKRPNGSICLYWTQADDPAQYIVWDSLDNS